MECGISSPRWFTAANFPDVVFIRAVVPLEGIELMAARWDRPVEHKAFASSPGKLCRSFGITTAHYGLDLCGSRLFLEDPQVPVHTDAIRTTTRVGISSRHEGYDALLRYSVRPADMRVLLDQS